MRLIDADALIELIDEGFDLNFDEVPETKRELIRMIGQQPTIEAEPVKRGRWTTHYVDERLPIPWGFDCSSCGEWNISGKDDVSRYKFCPNCGARMEVEDDATG